MSNWQALQSPKNVAQPNIKPKHFVGGCWKADAHKDGAVRVKSSGGARKSTKRTTFRIGVGIYKDKIFSPVVLRLPS